VRLRVEKASNFGPTICFSTMTMSHLTRRPPSSGFLAQKSITEVEHPTHSPHLVPYDFGLFPKIKYASKGQIFQDTKDTQKMS
jgi:hypothetical protein